MGEYLSQNITWISLYPNSIYYDVPEGYEWQPVSTPIIDEESIFFPTLQPLPEPISIPTEPPKKVKPILNPSENQRVKALIDSMGEKKRKK